MSNFRGNNARTSVQTLVNFWNQWTAAEAAAGPQQHLANTSSIFPGVRSLHRRVSESDASGARFDHHTLYDNSDDDDDGDDDDALSGFPRHGSSSDIRANLASSVNSENSENSENVFDLLGNDRSSGTHSRVAEQAPSTPAPPPPPQPRSASVSRRSRADSPHPSAAASLSNRTPISHITIDRSGDIIAQVMQVYRGRGPEAFRQPPRIVKFDGEIGRGIDAQHNGLRDEFINLVLRNIFAPERYLFERHQDDASIVCAPGADIHNIDIDDETTQQYAEFAGRMVAMAYLRDLPLPVHLSRHMARFISMYPMDVAYDDDDEHKAQLFERLYPDKQKQMLNIEDINNEQELAAIELTFPDDADKKVTQKNKQQYIRAYKIHIFEQAQLWMRIFCTGIYQVLSHEEWIQLHNSDSIAIALSGPPNFTPININEWKESSLVMSYHKPTLHVEERYSKRYLPPALYNTKEVFWKALKGFTPRQQKKLLYLITGHANSPPGGIKNISPPITLNITSDHTRLPVAHTCTRTLDIPLIENAETKPIGQMTKEMTSKLKWFINEADGAFYVV